MLEIKILVILVTFGPSIMPILWSSEIIQCNMNIVTYLFYIGNIWKETPPFQKFWFTLEIFAMKRHQCRNIGFISEIIAMKNHCCRNIGFTFRYIFNETPPLQKYWLNLRNICNKTSHCKNIGFTLGIFSLKRHHCRNINFALNILTMRNGQIFLAVIVVTF